MKDYHEFAQSVFKKSDKLLAAKAARNEKLHRLIPVTVTVCCALFLCTIIIRLLLRSVRGVWAISSFGRS